jgi:large subunit ribosomal protein L23
MNSHQVLVRPVITEKNTMLSEQAKYVFEIERTANKMDVARAVAEVFKVDVVHVNTIWVPGKTRRFGRRSGMTKPWKKAIVSLAAGQRIELFPGV